MIDEGYTKFSIDWIECAPMDLAEIHELRNWRRPLHAAGLIGYYPDIGVGYGNISMRIGSGVEFIISGTRTGHLAETGAEHYTRVTAFDIDANRVGCTGPVPASSESLTHACLYVAAPTIRAVVHVHSERLWTGMKGTLPTTRDDAAYGTPEMALEFGRLIHDSILENPGIAVMGGHEAGLISIGRTMKEAASNILALHAGQTAGPKRGDRRE